MRPMEALTALLAVGVAGGYFTIAALIVPRIELGEATPRFVAAFRGGGVAFFVGCGLTHLHIAYHAVVDEREAGFHEAGFHFLQIFGVWLFVYAALRFLEVRVTRRKTPDELEAEGLRDRVAALSRSNQDLEQFAQVVAHDLKAPLHSISGMAEILERRSEDRLDERSMGAVRHIREGSRRMTDLLDGVLEYSRVAAVALRREAVDLDAVASETLEALATAIEERGANVAVDPLPVVDGDRVQIGQLLQNLMANALKFGDPDAPRVHVFAEERDGLPVIAVQDNGAGIDPDEAERIFEVFERGSAGIDRPGTGVGLAVCAKIVGRHGGRLWHEPAPSGGSVFRFTLLPTATTVSRRPPAGAVVTRA
jgi:signal transduction histidine kinase